MRLIKYGVVLENLKEEDLEIVRLWRNSEPVRNNMQYKEIISPEMQAQWFRSLDKDRNLYFVIISEGRKAGLINLKDIDDRKKEAEAGIFIGESEFLNTIVPVAATILLMDFAFEELGLKKLKAKIGAENHKVIRFNEDIGYKKDLVQENDDFHYYSVTPKHFNSATKSIKETLNRM